MDNYNKELGDKRERIEDIEEKISEKTAEIKRLSEELDDIYDMKRQSDSDYEELLSYWAGTPAYLRISESNDKRDTLIRKLILNREDELRNAKEEKKRLMAAEEDFRHNNKVREEVRD